MCNLFSVSFFPPCLPAWWPGGVRCGSQPVRGADFPAVSGVALVQVYGVCLRKSGCLAALLPFQYPTLRCKSIKLLILKKDFCTFFGVRRGKMP